jgi:hypothetical protein
MTGTQVVRLPRLPARAQLAVLTLAVVAAVTGCRVKPLDGAKPGVDPSRPDASEGHTDSHADDGPSVSPDSACPALTPPHQAGEPCACDSQCATGFCQAGICCGGEACGARPLGATCQKDNQCDSSFCADGFCCNVGCKGGCFSCNQPEREGECLPLPAGAADLHGVCRKDAPETCGQSGLCNGQGGCAKYTAGSACGVASCSGPHTSIPGAECDGNGACVKGAALECAPFLCEGTSCRVTCTADTQCVAPAVCSNGSCGKRGKGQTCSVASDCASGFCTDGVCCESACGGRCQFCANPNARGSCVPVKADVVDPRAAAGNKDPAQVCLDGGPGACGNDGRCDGQGGCQKYPNGTTCRAGSCDTGANNETGAGTCLNGSCSVPAARSCAPFRGCTGTRCVGQCGSDAQCAAGNVCTNGSCGKRPIGALCTRDQDCAAPGICAQGRCCASACNGPCLSCNLAGSIGACSPVPAGGADPTGSCRNDACNNGCDGSGGCRHEAPGTACQADSCNGQSLTRHTCTTSGTCEARVEACPMGEICMGNRCAPEAKKPPGEICLGNGDCQSGACVAGRCCGSACATACHQCTAASNWMCAPTMDGSDCGGGRTCMGGNCVKKAAGATCQQGNECQSGSCIGNACCGNACAAGPCRTCSEATQWMCSNVANDTACGVGGQQICRDGACVAPCPLGQIQCAGVCVNPATDPGHCGGCRIRCPAGSCVAGVCGGGPDDCLGVLIRCNGACINPRINDRNCGACGVVCMGATPDCRMGVCMPAPNPGPGPTPLPQ